MTTKFNAYDQELLQSVNIDFKSEKFEEATKFGPPPDDISLSNIKRSEDLIKNWNELSKASLEALGLISERSKNIKISLPNNILKSVQLLFPNIKEVTFDDYKAFIELQKNNYSCGNEILDQIDPNKLTPEDISKLITKDITSPFSKHPDMDEFNRYLLILLLTFLLDILIEFLDFGGPYGVALKTILKIGLSTLQGILLEMAQSENMQKLKRQTSYVITDEYEKQVSNMFDENAVLISYVKPLYDNMHTTQCIHGMINSYGALAKQKDNSIIDNKASVNIEEFDDINRFHSNTTIHNKNNFEKLLNCIGCDSRIFNNFDLHPNNSILSMFEHELDSRKQQLSNLIATLYNVSVYEDLCLILNVFKQQCIPDLSIIFSLLNSYFLALTNDSEINVSSTIISQFIWPFIRNFLFQLLAVLQQYIDMTLGVLDCLTNALNFNILQQLGISTGTSRSPTNEFATLVNQMKNPFDAGLNKQQSLNMKKLKPEEYWENLGGKEFATAALKVNNLHDLIALSDKNNIIPKYITQSENFLKELRIKTEQKIDAIQTETFDLINEGLNGGQNYITDLFLKTFTTVENILDEQANGRSTLDEFILKKIKLIRLTSIIRALISGKSLRGFCEDDNSTPQAIKAFINEFLNDQPINITIDNNNIVIEPKITNQSVDTIINVLNGFDTQPLLSNSPTKIISIPDCLRNTQTNDINQVQEWIKELDNE